MENNYFDQNYYFHNFYFEFKNPFKINWITKYFKIKIYFLQTYKLLVPTYILVNENELLNLFELYLSKNLVLYNNNNFKH